MFVQSGRSQNRYKSYSLSWLISWATGRYYASQLATGTTTTAMTLNTIYTSTPIYIPHTVTITSMGVEVTAAASAGGTMRCALYELDQYLYPTLLTLDAGSFAVDSGTGWKGVSSLSVSVIQGWYFPVCVCSVAAPTLRFAQSPIPSQGGGARTPASQDDSLSMLRWAVSATEVANIVNNGFPSRLTPDPTIAAFTTSPRIMIGV
jgi:hypothetical protein